MQFFDADSPIVVGRHGPFSDPCKHCTRRRLSSKVAWHPHPGGTRSACSKNIVARSAPCFSAPTRGRRRAAGRRQLFEHVMIVLASLLAGYQTCPKSLPAIKRAPLAPRKQRERKDAGEAIGRVLALPPLGRQGRPEFTSWCGMGRSSTVAGTAMAVPSIFGAAERGESHPVVGCNHRSE